MAGLRDAVRHFRPRRSGLEQQVDEGRGHHRQQQGDDAFMAVGIAAGQRQHGEGTDTGHRHAGDQRQAEQQAQRDCAADQFGQGSGQDGGFTSQPGRLGPAGRQVAGRQRGQILPGGQRQARYQDLETQGQERRSDDDHQQSVATAAAAGDVGGPVARIDVAHGHQDAGADHAAQIRRHLGVLRKGGFAARYRVDESECRPSN
ncbi:hypothetical protein G6F50_014984 [Rhizopus delemar]|uniref:Uncharacterized protein n=1 Tax=Rhizopus delemar TaxID=936053 RepID=A0A9P6Y0Q2_9FUNG|nr:hypothetical protein G6F50_014984 [Rhizopus delemar]